MCGHGTIGTVTMAIENGLMSPKFPVRRDSTRRPAGWIAGIGRRGNIVEEVRLTNVPSFLIAAASDCPGLGEITVDVAYGGNFYAIVEPQENFRDMADVQRRRPLRWSPALRTALNAHYDSSIRRSPTSGASATSCGRASRPARRHARNAVFYGDKAIDRSPCGTGTSARMAQWAARGKLKVGDNFVHESIIGSLFEGRVEGRRASEIAMRSFRRSRAGRGMTGLNTIFIDDRDPFAHGFRWFGIESIEVSRYPHSASLCGWLTTSSTALMVRSERSAWDHEGGPGELSGGHGVARTGLMHDCEGADEPVSNHQTITMQVYAYTLAAPTAAALPG